MMDLVDEWAGYAGEPLPVVEERIAAAVSLLRAEWARYWGERDFSAQALRGFYETSEAMVYDALGRARLAQQEQWPQMCGEWLRRYDCRAVLDFGCGAGAFGFGLAEMGDPRFDVTLAELRCRHYGLLEHLAEHHPNAMVRHPEDLNRDTAYDAIVCLEVLEHVFDPCLAAAALLRRLRPGGIFFASWSFGGEEAQPAATAPHNPLHLRTEWTNDSYQEWLEGSFGLQWLNRGPCWARVLRTP